MAKASIYNRVADELGRRIIAEEMPEGSTVSLAELEEEFGVSRTVAREAMRLLQSLGMIRARPRVGLMVTAESKWQALDPRVIEWRLAGPKYQEQLEALIELRIAVEPIASRLAAVNATDEQREKLREYAATMRQLGESGLGASDEYVEADVQFHTILLQASKNPLFQALEGTLAAVLVGRTVLGLTPKYPDEEAMHNHDQIAFAVAEGATDLAEQNSRTLMAVVRQEMIPD